MNLIIFNMNQMLGLKQSYCKKLLLPTLILSSSLSFATLYPNSIVSTDFDFIRTSDPDNFLCLTSHSEGEREMPDKRYNDKELLETVYIFEAHYKDGTTVEFNISKEIGDLPTAKKEAQKYTHRLGRLPTKIRKGLDRIVVHKGDETAFAEVGFMILYSENTDKRISTNDLEETMFHESIHSVFDAAHADSTGWLEAQKRDGAFVTEYAAKKPGREDLAESALFAYTIARHPERFPENERTKIKATMPNRIEYINKLLPPEQPTFYSIGTQNDCSGKSQISATKNQFSDESTEAFNTSESVDQKPSLPPFDETKSKLHARLNQQIIALLKTDPIQAEIRHDYYTQILDHIDEFTDLRIELISNVKAGNMSIEEAQKIYRSEAQERRQAVKKLIETMKKKLKQN